MKPISKRLIKRCTYWIPKLNTSSKLKSNSWFFIKQTLNSKLKTFPTEIKSDEIRCKKIILNPSLKQRNILLTWMELYRRSYNMTVKEIKKDNEKNTFYNLRKVIKEQTKENFYFHSIIKKTKILQHTLDNAVKDVIKARKTAFTNLKLKNIKYFRMRYKKYLHHLKTLVIEPSAFNKNGLGLNNKLLRDLKPTQKIEITKECRLNYNKRTKNFTLCVPYEKKLNDIIPRSSICSLDPGVRTFQSIYSPDGNCYEIVDDKKIVDETLNRIEKVKLLKDKKWYKKYISRLREKLKNRIADLHWKTSNFLCKRFNNILIGNMSTKDVIKNKKSVLNDATKRKITTLSHYLFKERLKSKCKEYNVTFKEVDESYTSKTCGCCGELNNNLKSSKIFHCNNCNFMIDRDFNGARNILIKNE